MYAAHVSRARLPLYLLYWYKSTNTDAKGGAARPTCVHLDLSNNYLYEMDPSIMTFVSLSYLDVSYNRLKELPGTQFTCFTGTKVQILTRYRATRHSGGGGTQFTCVTGTKVQIVTAEALRARAHRKPARTRDVSRGWQHAHELAVFDGLPRFAAGIALIQP